MSIALELTLDECAELLTDGGNDAGVDGLHVGDVEEGDLLVTLFQGKYRVRDLEGLANFPENSLQKVVDTVRVLFDPQRRVTLNQKIAPRIEEVRSLIRDGYIPTVRVVLCNNGAKWTSTADHRVQEARKEYGSQLEFIHFNHDAVVDSLRRGDRINASITLTGKAVVEDMNYLRVLVGRVSVQEISRLLDEHGDQLLQRNIRRYLGHANRVNTEIRETLLDSEKSDNFYFFNNGVTMICDHFDYNAFQTSDYQVQVQSVQVINGAQTCKTIQQTLHDNGTWCAKAAYVLVRIYQLPRNLPDMVTDITKATNSQSPVDMRDLRSSDQRQVTLELGMEQLGYTYKRQREESGPDERAVSSTTVAESVLSVWRAQPHQAKFRRREHFGKLYDTIFEGLSAPQALLATLIYRFVERERRLATDDSPDFLPYASHHLAMLIGRDLLVGLQIAPSDISHRSFPTLQAALESDGERHYAAAVDSLKDALRRCYGDREVSLQQLAATFRRGDLLEMLNAPDGL